MAASEKYAPGVNAILNALEHYNFNADMHLYEWGEFLPPEYKMNWPKVSFHSLDSSWWPEMKPAAWYCKHGMAWHAQELLDDYPVVLIWGADVCPVNNFDEWFEVAEKTEKLIVGMLEYGNQLHDMSGLSLDWPYRAGWSVPWADIPFFVTQKSKNVLSEMFAIQAREGNVLSHMNGMNYAIRDSGVDFLAVPGEWWNFANPTRIKLVRRYGDTIYHMGSTLRLQAFHRAYWDISLCRRYMENSEPCRSNKLLLHQMWAWFNTEHRVKWGEGWSVWDGT